MIMRCHSLSHIITRYYPLGWKEPFSFGKSKISFQASVFFVTSYQSFSLLFTPHHTQLQRGKENNYHLATWKLVPIRQNFYHILLCLATRCHTLSPYHRGYPRLERKSFLFGNLVPVLHFFFKSYQALPLLIKPHHTLSHTRETKPFSFDNLRIVPRLQIFFHILSHLVTPHRTSSHLIPPHRTQKYFH